MPVKHLEKGQVVIISKIDKTNRSNLYKKSFLETFIGKVLKVRVTSDNLQQCLLGSESINFDYNDLDHHELKKPEGGLFNVQNLVH